MFQNDGTVCQKEFIQFLRLHITKLALPSFGNKQTNKQTSSSLKEYQLIESEYLWGGIKSSIGIYLASSHQLKYSEYCMTLPLFPQPWLILLFLSGQAANMFLLPEDLKQHFGMKNMCKTCITFFFLFFLVECVYQNNYKKISEIKKRLRSFQVFKVTIHRCLVVVHK